MSPKGGSQEIAKGTITAQLKMEDACILWNVIFLIGKKKPRSKEEDPLAL